jgi:lipid-A-disaccharide synthase-like uncharacterized protein
MPIILKTFILLIEIPFQVMIEIFFIQNIFFLMRFMIQYVNKERELTVIITEITFTDLIIF